MSSILGSLGSIAAETAGETIAYAAGSAGRESLSPVGEAIAQVAWSTAPIRLPAAEFLALGVAQGQVDPGEAAGWARKHGYDGDRFDAMVAIARTGPELGRAYAAWRRDLLTDADFEDALHRSGLEPRWFAAMKALKQERLDPVQLANAIHRGLIPDPGLLAVAPPIGAGKVPAYPVYPIDALEEAAAHGIDRERLGTLVGLTGLPMGSHEAANAVFRNIITHLDFERAIAEGNTRNEWGAAIFEQSRQIPTARDFVENALRGYRTLAAALEGAALHGMSAADATMIYQNQGRPMALRQITQALARGGKFEPEPGEIGDPYHASIVEGNLKPAYYDLAFANRYTLPGAFVIRGMASAGELSRAETERLLLESGWKPDLAAKAARRWTSGGSGGSKNATKAELSDEFEGGYISEDEYRAALAVLGYAGAELELEVNLAAARRLKRWREKIVDAIAKAYLAYRLDDAAAISELAEVSVLGEAATMLLHLWGIERRDTIATLTPAQIAKAFKKGLETEEKALAELEERGYSAADAAILLHE